MPAAPWTRAGALVGFGLGCAALGAWWGHAPAAPAAAVAAVAIRLSPADLAALRRDLADDVRRAVAAALPPATPFSAPATPAAPAAPAAEPAAEQDPARMAQAAAAHDAARHVVDDAIARGAWRPEDGQALRTVLAELDQPAMTQVLGDLSRAINTGKLQIAQRDRPIF